MGLIHIAGSAMRPTLSRLFSWRSHLLLVIAVLWNSSQPPRLRAAAFPIAAGVGGRRVLSSLGKKKTVSGDRAGSSAGSGLPAPPRRRRNALRRARNPIVAIGAASDEAPGQSADDQACEKVDEAKGVGFYVHIPYCRRRCRYCDFAIVPIGPVDTSEGGGAANGSTAERQSAGFRRMDEAYRDAVLSEIELIRHTTEGRVPLRSVYFGGGTPSLAPLATLRSILDAILCSPDSPFFVPKGEEAEITIEMDPGTFDLSKLLSLKDMGFNRISLGVQSFDDAILEAIGRVHRRADVMESVGMIHDVFNDRANYSVDLISGLPGLTLSKWAETLELAVALDPPPAHLSLYDLQVEQGTVFGRWYKEAVRDESEDEQAMAGSGVSGTMSRSDTLTAASVGLLPLPTPDDCAFMYRYASGYLRSRGYEHYEISSYAGSTRSHHNQIYWEIGADWYAVGLGAASSIGGKRFTRPRSMSEYVLWLKEQKESFLLGRAEGSETGKVAWRPSWHTKDTKEIEPDSCNGDLFYDMIMTRLRTAEGLNLDWIKRKCSGGEGKVKAVLRGADLALSLGLAERIQTIDGDDYLALVDPNGFLFSNSIISSIFVELDVVEEVKATGTS